MDHSWPSRFLMKKNTIMFHVVYSMVELNCIKHTWNIRRNLLVEDIKRAPWRLAFWERIFSNPSTTSVLVEIFARVHRSVHCSKYCSSYMWIKFKMLNKSSILLLYKYWTSNIYIYTVPAALHAGVVQVGVAPVLRTSNE